MNIDPKTGKLWMKVPFGWTWMNLIARPILGAALIGLAAYVIKRFVGVAEFVALLDGAIAAAKLAIPMVVGLVGFGYVAYWVNDCCEYVAMKWRGRK